MLENSSLLAAEHDEEWRQFERRLIKSLRNNREPSAIVQLLMISKLHEWQTDARPPTLSEIVKAISKLM